MSLLSGPKILEEVAAGRIVIDPTPAPEHVNPNSINLSVGPTLRVYTAQLAWLEPCYQTKLTPWEAVRWSRPGRLPPEYVLDPYEANATEEVPIPPGGLDLVPGVFYLGHTVEVAGSVTKYAPMLEGRSTWARLGFQCHLSAGWGDCGWPGAARRAQWTLEVTVETPVTVRPGDYLCQVGFVEVVGPEQLYAGRYLGQTGPTPAKPLPR